MGISELFAANFFIAAINVVLSTAFEGFAITGIVLYFTTGRFKFIFVPMAVDNTDLTLKECTSAAKKVSYVPFRMYFKGYAMRTLLLLLASLFTIGILHIIYTGPLLITKKTAYYTAHKIN